MVLYVSTVKLYHQIFLSSNYGQFSLLLLNKASLKIAGRRVYFSPAIMNVNLIAATVASEGQYTLRGNYRLVNGNKR